MGKEQEGKDFWISKLLNGMYQKCKIQGKKSVCFVTKFLSLLNI